MEGIKAKNVCKTYIDNYGKKFYALKDISFYWRKGEILSIVGESGSGKSTLARVLIGIECIDSGEIEIKGTLINKLKRKEWLETRKMIQVVFQDAKGTMDPAHSVYSNVEETLRNLSDLNSIQRRRKITELMDEIKIDKSLLKNSVKELSGGEQRRLSLVRALAIKPEFLILDEITSGLDLVSKDAILQLLEKYHKEYGLAYLNITHDLESAYRISDRIIRMNEGQIVEIANKVY